MNYWLIKSEPDECSIDDFVRASGSSIRWDGIRNFQARNFLRDMQLGDAVLLYHSSCKQIGIVGTLEVTRTAFTDPLQFDPQSAYFDPKANPDNPRWDAVELTLLRRWQKRLSREQIKTIAQMQNSLLLTRPRLSVMPLSQTEWAVLHQASEESPAGHRKN